LLGRFSSELGRGRSVADALRVAKGSAMDGGMHPGGWAGVIVLGDGDLKPLRGHGPWVPWKLVLGIASLAFVGAMLMKRAR